jgi:hypothetical protein
MTRSSLKKHDSAVESRALKARRDRVTTQVRKDKRRQAVQTKRRRLMSTDDTQLTGRDISELVAILADASSASVDAHQERFNVLREIRVLLSTHEHDYDVIEKIIESGVRLAVACMAAVFFVHAFTLRFRFAAVDRANHGESAELGVATGERDAHGRRSVPRDPLVPHQHRQRPVRAHEARASRRASAAAVHRGCKQHARRARGVGLG